MEFFVSPKESSINLQEPQNVLSDLDESEIVLNKLKPISKKLLNKIETVP